MPVNSIGDIILHRIKDYGVDFPKSLPSIPGFFLTEFRHLSRLSFPRVALVHHGGNAPTI
ncbi:MAG: hypothetical protein LDL41_02520 [Coleofasciculus sp. S288]|nr:hypothetical protein [Coleofasciculus sp. S288]